MKTNALLRVIAVSAFLAGMFLSGHALMAQEPEETPFTYALVEEKPVVEIDGKMTELGTYMQLLMSQAKTPEGGKSGRVICTLIISSKGEIADVKIMRSLDEKTDAAAVELIRKYPKWTPGRQSGEAVATSIAIPLNFR